MPRPFAPVKPPPLAAQDGASYPRLVALMQRLLAEDGCPWDRQQTFSSLRRYLMEEACEALDAIDRGDLQELGEELGDVLLQVVFLGELARREGAFGPDDVVASIVNKLIRRHPHVFSDSEADSPAEVAANWETIKAAERAAKGEVRTLLDGVPRSLPALLRAQRLGAKAAKVGFDWPDHEGPRAKVHEELRELEQAIDAKDSPAVEAEFGDLLFSMVNLARHLGVDPEAALRACNRKFVRRFEHVEAAVEREHGGFAQGAAGALELAQLDRYWEAAKAAEAENQPHEADDD